MTQGDYLWNCSSCEHTEDECKDCYPELGYKNNKLKRDTEAVEKFVESDAFSKLMESLDKQDRAATEDADTNTNKSDKEMLVEAGTKPIGLTREMLGIEETGAVVAGRNQKKDIDICAGDEIITDGERCIVLWLGNRLQFPYLLHQDGSVSAWVSAFNALKEKKTGRHFDIDRIWREME
jgi:hypothetical protein